MARQPTRLADFEIPRGESVPPDLSVVEDAPSAGLKESATLPRDELTRDPAPQKTASVSPAPEASLADIVPVRIAPRPAVEARQAMTVRLPVSMHERIRTLMFTSRRSQQDIVEAALHAFLSANQK
jgi:hypothetical protein